MASFNKGERTAVADVKLDIVVDPAHYCARDINHGQLAREFFEALTANVFRQSHRFWRMYNNYAGFNEMPLLYSERNLYSTFATAIGDLTPVHLSEWPFTTLPVWAPKDSRVVDFWCLSRPRQSGKALNYFLELKHGYYSISSGTDEGLNGDLGKKVDEAIHQIYQLKKLNPDWGGDGAVFMALVVIPGYHANSRSVAYGPKDILSSLHRRLDGRSGAQLIMSTWSIPRGMELDQLDNRRCAFVSIAGIVLTRKR